MSPNEHRPGAERDVELAEVGQVRQILGDLLDPALVQCASASLAACLSGRSRWPPAAARRADSARSTR